MKKIILCAALSFIFSGCVIVPPKIQLTGERTQIETQIIGEYSELEDDAWIISTMRTNVQRNKSGINENDEILQSAKNIRIVNEDKISYYKEKEALVEALDGMLKYRKISLFEENKSKKEELMKIISSENLARKQIIKYNASVSQKSEKEEALIFGQKQQSDSIPGEWIETSVNVWVKKK